MVLGDPLDNAERLFAQGEEFAEIGRASCRERV